MKFLRHSLRLLVLGQGVVFGAWTALAGPAQGPPPEAGAGGPAAPRAMPGPGGPHGPGRFGGGRIPGANAWRNGNGAAARNPVIAAQRQSLTPEDRQRLFAARAAVMNDPQVRAAQANRQADPRAFRMAVRDAMIRTDPSLAGTFQKMQQAAQAARGEVNQKFQNRVDFLSEDERATLVRSRQAVQDDPAVAAARQQRDSAGTPEARQKAERAYNQAVQGAMMKNDAKVGPILDKIRQQRVTETPKSGPSAAPR